MQSDLRPLLMPRSVAIVGVSPDISRIGGRLRNNLITHGYDGKVYLVNPKYQEIDNMKCYPSIDEISDPIDAILVAVPANGVFEVLEQAGRKSVKYAIIYSSGFSEIGVGGQQRQRRLQELTAQFRLSVCGPNCVGIINFHNRIVMSFSQFLEIPKLIPGQIAFISQSGALGGALLNRAQDSRIGFSYFISTGNEVVLDSSDFIEYLIYDRHTKVIMALLEEVRNPEKFLMVADLALEQKKPIIVMKIGRTAAGRNAASSHTGSMTGSDEVYNAVFKQKGIVRVDDLDELYLTAAAFAKSKLPKGNRIGILTSTGGGGVILTDKLIQAGLDVPHPTPETVRQLSEVVPSFVSVNNPFDLTAQLINDPSLFRLAFDVFSDDDNFDAIIVATSMVSSHLSQKRASFIIEGAKTVDKPFFSWWAAGSLSAPGMNLLEESQVPFFSSANQCVNTVASLVHYAQFEKPTKKDSSINIVPETKQSIKALLKNSINGLTEDQGKEILSLYDIPVVPEQLCRNPQEAIEASKKIGFPVALKIVSPQITHKTEGGLLRLNIKEETELVAAYTDIINNVETHYPQAKIIGFLVQKMLKPGKEVIIGVSHDPQFGPMVMFGLGGIFVEVLEDFSLRRAPLREEDAWQMIQEIKAYRLLEGVRGDKPSDMKAIVSVLLAISHLAIDLEDDVSEIDINPFIVYPEGEGGVVVDCLFIKKGFETL